ncbi:MAG: ketopantoate reductase family protein, partial [Anaerolineae bacterium]
MKVIVVGTGAIGGYVGAKLALAGDTLTFVGRQPLADAVAARGLRLIEPEGQSVVQNCEVVTSPAAAFAQPERFDLALFTVKTHDTHTAIDELRPYADRVDRFLSLQNGVSSEDLLGEAFSCEKIVAGTILNPVSIQEPGVLVLEKRKGGVGVGVVSRRRLVNQLAAVEALASHFHRAGFVVRTYADYRAMKWSKLLLNLIGNASSAILDLNTMQVFADKRIFSIEIAALREAVRVARTQGIRFVGLPGYPVPLLVAAARFLPLPLLQLLLIPLVAKGRGGKMPSLHIDLSNSKRRSEIDELNGVVVRAGARLNIPTPANALLFETFKDLQSGRAARSDWRHRADRLWV